MMAVRLKISAARREYSPDRGRVFTPSGTRAGTLSRFWVAVFSVIFLLAMNPMVLANENAEAHVHSNVHSYEHLDEPREPLPPIDAVLLIDVSGSMRFTDPNRAALTAASDFIDMLTLGESRVGVVGFSGLIQYYMPLRLVEDEHVQAELRREITRFQYVGFTDIGAALLAAAEMLYHAENVQNPMVLLMSDGWIEISPQMSHRTTADSYADVETALDMLERTVPVYTIGIHNPMGVDAELLEMISTRSDGYSQFTYDANELPEMFISILEAHVAAISMEVHQPEADVPDEPEQESEQELEQEPEVPEPDESELNEATTERDELEPTTETPIPEPEPIPPSPIPATPPPEHSTSEPDYEYPAYEPPVYDYGTEPHDSYDYYDYDDEYTPYPFGGRLLRGILYTLAFFSGFTALVGVIRFVRAVMK